MNFNLSQIPDRNQQPRTSGLTMGFGNIYINTGIPEGKNGKAFGQGRTDLIGLMLVIGGKDQVHTGDLKRKSGFECIPEALFQGFIFFQQR